MGKRDRDGSAAGGKNKRSKYNNVDTAFKGLAMPIGKQGILITMDSGETHRAQKEALLVLNEVYEELCPPAADAAASEAAETPSTTDYSNLIASEVSDLKDKKKRRFRMHETGLRNCIFAEMTVDEGGPGPNKVVQKLLEDAKQTQRLQFRHCARFLPCTHICKSDKDSIKAFAAEVVPQLIDCSPEAAKESVAVLYEHRAAPNLDRMELIDAFVDQVPRPPHEVKLRGASKTISVQVVRNACGVGVIDNYHDLYKCNIKSICNPPKTEAEAASKGDPAKDLPAAASSAPDGELTQQK